MNSSVWNGFDLDYCYLDHIGAGLYADSQMEAILADFKCTLYSNPHSSGTGSIQCKDNIEQMRYRLSSVLMMNNFYYEIWTRN